MYYNRPVTSPGVIVLTAFGTIAMAVEAMRQGAFDFLTKPFGGEHLAVVIEKALAHAALRRSGWNQTKAAELLGLNRTHLTKLLKQKGLPCKPPQA